VEESKPLARDLQGSSFTGGPNTAVSGEVPLPPGAPADDDDDAPSELLAPLLEEWCW